MATTVEVRDQHGGFVQARKEPITGQILIHICDARTGEEEQYLVNPKDPKVIDWLKKVYQPIHLDILLGD